MRSRLIKACDVVKWGKTDLWDIFEAAHVLLNMEPSRDPNPYFEPKADALYRQLSVSIAMGFPKIAGQIGIRHLFLPLQLVDWAVQKGYALPKGLEDEVRKTAKANLERLHKERQIARPGIKIDNRPLHSLLTGAALDVIKKRGLIPQNTVATTFSKLSSTPAMLTRAELITTSSAEVTGSTALIGANYPTAPCSDLAPSAIPGVLPRIAVGKLAVKAAWEIEGETQRKASDKDVMTRLQQWADNGKEPAYLKESIKGKRSVIWVTNKSKEKEYTLDACQKTLETWNESRE